jgi:hypothetical protein
MLLVCFLVVCISFSGHFVDLGLPTRVVVYRTVMRDSFPSQSWGIHSLIRAFVDTFGMTIDALSLLRWPFSLLRWPSSVQSGELQGAMRSRLFDCRPDWCEVRDQGDLYTILWILFPRFPLFPWGMCGLACPLPNIVSNTRKQVAWTGYAWGLDKAPSLGETNQTIWSTFVQYKPGVDLRN